MSEAEQTGHRSGGRVATAFVSVCGLSAITYFVAPILLLVPATSLTVLSPGSMEAVVAFFRPVAWLGERLPAYQSWLIWQENAWSTIEQALLR